MQAPDQRRCCWVRWTTTCLLVARLQPCREPGLSVSGPRSKKQARRSKQRPSLAEDRREAVSCIANSLSRSSVNFYVTSESIVTRYCTYIRRELYIGSERGVCDEKHTSTARPRDAAQARVCARRSRRACFRRVTRYSSRTSADAGGVLVVSISPRWCEHPRAAGSSTARGATGICPAPVERARG